MSKKQETIDLLNNVSSMVEEHGLSASVHKLINNLNVALEAMTASTEDSQYTPHESHGVIFTVPTAITDDMKEKIAIAIGKFEKDNNVDFPSVYFSISKNANGGVPSNKKIDIDGVEKVCEHFLTWNVEGANAGELEKAYESIKKDNKKVVPFAILLDKSYLCFNFKNKDEEPEVVRLHSGEVSDVAKDFVEFLQKLNK